MTAVWLGALLVVAGVVYMAWAATRRGRMSDPHPTPTGTTLEPARRGVGFLGLKPNWPGVLMIAAGAILLLGGLL
ncbi:hypothetical protein [Kumtagia ephedrae]|jgi:hypothetical protein|uniref:Uncharacterized protein n=1 Tax=Kumtagia ephedrae TaxID=2116701 RepID=A0A2P7SC73_9HYPH|nr:hypothetical protein [Mesorhizobium ephedrae]PSJ60124.1 hypothetical protein C7I84_12625 [Mesorhizobium ephedrae]